jgi:ABC-type transport system involved in cytochrome bd biosynthesis fused ATPase/permease subunit
LTTGEIKQSLTMEFVANGMAVVPAASGAGKVSMTSRLEGLTAAKGE